VGVVRSAWMNRSFIRMASSSLNSSDTSLHAFQRS
jgi:hypothetical protein